VATAAAATAAILTGLGLVDRQATAAVLLVVQAVDGGLGLGVGVHLDEPEALAAPGVAILNHLGAVDGAELREQLLQVGTADRISQVPNVQLLAHQGLRSKGRTDPSWCFPGRGERGCS